MAQAKSSKSVAAKSAIANVAATVVAAPVVAKQVKVRANLPVTVKAGKAYTVGAGNAQHQARMSTALGAIKGNTPTASIVAAGVAPSHISYMLRRGFLLPA